MEPNDFLVTRLNQITEAVVQKNWGHAYKLIQEWEADERPSTSPNRELASTSPNRELDHTPTDGWGVDDSPGLQFGELAECFN